MNNKLVVEQLRLHFGEEYVNIASQTRKFCTTILNKPWWGRNRASLLGNEGGYSGIELNAMMSIIEHQDNSDCPYGSPIADPKDIVVGLKAYGRYLRSQYGSEILSTLPLLDELEYTSPKIGGEHPLPTIGEGCPLVPLGTHSLYESSDAEKTIVPGQDVLTPKNKYSDNVLRYITMSGEELQFFGYYANVLDVREASGLMGISYNEGLRMHNRVKHRAARRDLVAS